MGDDTDVRNRDSGGSYRPGLAIGAGLVIGAGLGISLGSIYGDVAMGMVAGAALGLIAGAALDGFIRAATKRNKSDGQEERDDTSS